MAQLPIPGGLPIPDFGGKSIPPGDPEYPVVNDLYATSTYGLERNMHPGEILQPTSIDDIVAVVKAANARKQKLAVRTGGHQYSGASSTTPNNLQLDLRRTFRNPNDMRLIRKDGKTYLRTSVSFSLKELFDFTMANNVFMPTGQCISVCLGGHSQTGGYGMFGRSLGLLGDYMHSLETVSPTGNQELITKEATPGPFYGFMGGSPGNMGVVHHVTVEVQEDANHPNSRGDRILLWYNKKNYKAALDILSERAEDPDWPREWDLTVNLYSEGIPLGKLFSGDKKRKLKAGIPDEQIDDPDWLTLRMPVIIVYLQWINFGVGTYDDRLLKRFEAIGWHITIPSKPGESVSSIASQWLFDHDREYPYPYVKRTNATNSTTLTRDGWSTFMSEQMDKIVPHLSNGLYVSSQIQVSGGRHSQIAQHAGNGTAYSWRDSTVSGTWDVFFKEGKKAEAEAWQKKNDENLFGSKGLFCKEERRLLWGSYGNWNLAQERAHYYEPGVFEKLQRIRTDVDPNDTFSPNPFCVPTLIKSRLA
jgi:hypothetical protein